MAEVVSFAGSNQIAHIVDCVLFLENDRDTPLKFLRAAKNRFGDINEVGVFMHTESGLEGVSDPSGILIDEDDENLPGTAVGFISEGIRQIPVEIQVLVTSSNLPTPRKQFNGINYNRAQIVCAILDKFCKLKLNDNDTFGNTVSGIKVNDPVADLAIAAAAISSSKNKSLNERTAFIGELSLTGQVRGSMMMDNKITEAERLGFDSVVVPKMSLKNISKKHIIKVIPIAKVSDLLGIFS